EVNLENLFDFSHAAIAAAFAVAFINQELVLVECRDLADTRAGGQKVGIFVRRLAAGYVNGDKAQQLRGCDCILNQRVLHDADQRSAIGRDSKSFHALVGYAAAGVVGDFNCAHWTERADEQVRGKFEGTQAHAEEAVELINVRAVLVRDINPQAVVGKTDAFGIQTAIVGVSGIVIGIEIV